MQNNMNGAQIGGQVEPGQVTNGAMSGNNIGNGMGGPTLEPPKSPANSVNPAKKKKIILGVILGLAGVIVAVIVVIMVVIFTKVDYGESYRAVKELQTDLNEFTGSRGCRNAISYLDAEYIDVEDYAEYASECRRWGDSLDEAVNKLGETAAIKKDSEIKEQYEKFREGLMSILPSQENLDEKMKIAEAWHTYQTLRRDLSNESTDAQVNAAANALIESGNDQLKTYGEGWSERALELTHSYQAWINTPYTDTKARNALYEAYRVARTEYSEWVTANQPDIAGIVNIETADMSKLNTEFNKLRLMIAKRYEENYDSESGDCWEFLGEVTCN